MKLMLIAVGVYAVVGLSACSDDNRTNQEIIDQDDPPRSPNFFGGPGEAADVSSTYSEEQMELVSRVIGISQSHGLEYDFNEMYPFIEDRNDEILVYFYYNDPLYMGGSPRATISKENNEILSIQYTQ